jgi:hypothetical protein
MRIGSPKNSLTSPLHSDRRKFIIVMQRLLAAGERGRSTS